MVEQHAQMLQKAVAYFNVDVAVSGTDFEASAVPSLKEFVRGVTRSVPSPLGGTVYQEWKVNLANTNEHRTSNVQVPEEDVQVGDLGSGSDFTPFLQHVAALHRHWLRRRLWCLPLHLRRLCWYTMNADPHFVYLQQMARVFGLEAVRMADSDVLPLDYVTYASRNLRLSRRCQTQSLGNARLGSLDFAPAQAAVARLANAPQAARTLERLPQADLSRLNAALRQTETDFISVAGLPNRPWYRHTIYAPGEFTGLLGRRHSWRQ